MNLLCTSWTEFTDTSKIVARTSAEDILNQRLVVLKDAVQGMLGSWYFQLGAFCK